VFTTLHHSATLCHSPRCIDKEGDAKDWINGILFLDTQSVISVLSNMADDVNRSSDVVK
jgi:hypothetical protein